MMELLEGTQGSGGEGELSAPGPERRRLGDDGLAESVSLYRKLWTEEEHGFQKKNQSMVQKKEKLKQNSIAELVGTSVSRFLATSS